MRLYNVYNNLAAFHDPFRCEVTTNLTSIANVTA